MKKFILWDNDGVLVDTEKYYYKANKKILDELGIKLNLDTYRQVSLNKGKSVLELARNIGLNDEQMIELRDRRDVIYEGFIFNQNLAIDGAGETLETLSVHFRMAVVTSTKRDYFEKLHVITGFRKYFEYVIAREDYKTAKPHPEAYLLGIKNSGYSPDEIIAVEDTPRGLIAANLAGIDCIVIPNNFTRNANFIGEKLKLNSIRDITQDLLNKLN
ncbi:MAG: HAD family hydrolase [Ignavibacteriae bacterium HGW-Ignavibacteriae-2]|jgi:HAD superfamily hydrolase (TIGR01509 family)|nr:MAG: HAD family hydrolase [Ignavibacteriae bacterium HGW-Ignavibacteriae-2]